MEEYEEEIYSLYKEKADNKIATELCVNLAGKLMSQLSQHGQHGESQAELCHPDRYRDATRQPANNVFLPTANKTSIGMHQRDAIMRSFTAHIHSIDRVL